MPIVLNGSGAVTGLTTLPDSAMASGSVIQVVQGGKTDGEAYSIGTGAFSSTIMSATITPKFSSSKILITGILNSLVGKL